MDKRIIAYLAIAGILSSGYALAQTTATAVKADVRAPMVEAASKVPVPDTRQVSRQVMCRKSDSGGCVSIECDDGFTMRQCQGSPTVKETVECVFANTGEAQKCSSEKGGCTAYPLRCAGGKCPVPERLSCKAAVSGAYGEVLAWKSSCGGYAQTTIDGSDETVKFDCGKPTCKEYLDEYGCFVRTCSDGTQTRGCPALELKGG